MSIVHFLFGLVVILNGLKQSYFDASLARRYLILYRSHWFFVFFLLVEDIIFVLVVESDLDLPHLPTDTTGALGPTL